MPPIWDTGTAAIGLAAVAAFAAAFHFSGLAARTRAVVRSTREAAAVLTDANLDDEAKEHLLRRRALELFADAARISLAAGLVLAVPGAVLWIGDATGHAPFADSSAFLMSPEVIIGSSVVVITALVLAGRRR